MPEEKRKKDSFLRTMEIAGLGFSVIFELAAGPFIGLLIGSYLVNHFGLHRSFLIAMVFIGFVTGIYNVTVSIRMMKKIDQGSK